MGALIQLLLFTVGLSVAAAQGRSFWHRCNWCAENAECVDDSFCRCKEGLVGDPYLFCVNPKDYIVCVHCNDPVIATENGDNVLVPYFGVTRLADEAITTTTQKEARLRISVATYRVRGKVLARYLLIWIRFTDRFGNICHIRFRICAFFLASATTPAVQYEIASGSTSDGRTQWNNETTLSTRAQKSWPKTLCECVVTFEVKKGGILSITFSCLPGVVICIRPHVIFSGWLKSGIVIKFPRPQIPNKPLPDTWNNYPVCLNPAIAVVQVQASLQLSHPRHAMAYLALTQQMTGIPEYTQAQDDMAQAVRACSVDKRRELFNRAFFMMHLAPFINCISDNAAEPEGFGQIMSVVQRAAEWICKWELMSCTTLITEIMTKCKSMLNDPRYPELDEFIGRGCVLP